MIIHSEQDVRISRVSRRSKDEEGEDKRGKTEGKEESVY